MRTLLTTTILLTLPFCLSAQHFYKADFHLFLEVQKAFEVNHISFDELAPKIDARAKVIFPTLLDNEKEFLLEKDVEELIALYPKSTEPKEREIDTFLERTYDIFKKRVDERLAHLNTIGAQDFFEKDSILIDIRNDSTHYHSNRQELNTYWNSLLKYMTLARYSGDSTILGKDEETTNEILNERLKELLNKEMCRLESLTASEKVRDQVRVNFLRAYAKSFDPHSDYLSSREVESFVATLTTERFGTGLVFRQKSAKYEVTEKVPFSSADLNKEIAIGDQILSIKNNSDLLPIACFNMPELEQVLHGAESRTVTYEIKSNKDKKVRQVTLEKTLLNSNENHTYAYQIKGDSTDLGYIQFPGFYSNMDGVSRSSSQDLALIMLKLRRAEIDGLILDLRGNGGGSVAEAFDVISYFVDYGPLHILATTDNIKGTLIKDGKRGKLVDSKVIFLVDAFTASASEILIASLQMYPGFMVVGSSTYGKATGYIPIPITLPLAKDDEGMALVTNLKVYNLKGETYQGVGVKPDVKIPGIYSKELVSESLLAYTLPQDMIAKKFKPILPRLEPIDTISERSLKRIASDPVFQEVNEVRQQFVDAVQSPFYQSLHFDDYKIASEEDLSIETAVKDPIFEVVPMEENEVFLRKSEDYKKTMEKDPVLKEVFQIFEDWISITPN